ncbi:hypothetical protein ABK040_011594 [Willaertia magna]
MDNPINNNSDNNNQLQPFLLRVIEHTNPELFYKRVKSYLQEYEAQNNLMFGIISSLINTPSKYDCKVLLTIEDYSNINNNTDNTDNNTENNNIELVVVWTPPYPMNISYSPYFVGSSQQELSTSSSLSSLEKKRMIVLEYLMNFLLGNNSKENDQENSFLKRNKLSLSGIGSDNSEAEWFAKEWTNKFNFYNKFYNNNSDNKIGYKIQYKERIYSLIKKDLVLVKNKPLDEICFTKITMENENEIKQATLLFTNFFKEIFNQDKSHDFIYKGYVEPCAKNNLLFSCQVPINQTETDNNENNNDKNLKMVISVACGFATPSGARISLVITAPEYRRKGIASYMMSCIGEELLIENCDLYKVLFLFTDLDNPTSNSVYQKIGFKEVRNLFRIEFN